MADLSSELHKDIRLVERNLAKGFMSRAAADKLVKDLPDVADKADWIDIDDDAADEPTATDED